MLLTLILWTTDKSTRNKVQSTQAKKCNILDNIGNASSIGNIDEVGGNNKNLSNTKKLKNLARPKKSTLAKTDSFETNFLTFEAKKPFICL